MTIPAEVLSHARRLRARTRRLVDGYFAGHYLSVFKGSGVEFAEVREYVDGDDIRTIDWNVTARHDRAYVKRYVEERNLTVLLAVDVSASTAFGSGEDSKRECAVKIALAIAVAALRNSDRVGLLLFSDEIECYIAPRRGRNTALEIATTLLTYEPRRRQTSVDVALAFIRRICRQRALVFLLSDFIDDGDYTDGLRALAARHDLIPVHLHDRNERSLPDVGLLAVQDLESGAHTLIDTRSPRVREAYARQRERDAAGLAKRFRRLGLDWIDIDGEEEWIAAVLRFFHLRRRRVERGR